MPVRKILLLCTLLALTVVGCKLTSEMSSPAGLLSTDTPTATATAASQTATSTATTQPTAAPSTTPDLKKTQDVLNLQATEAAATQAGAAATQQAAAMADKIRSLAEAGVVGSTTGDYYRLDDFDQSWAQLGWYQWWSTDYTADNFVISAQAAWESASDKANWPDAGCGFIFSLEDKSNHNYGYLGLDGFARLVSVRNGSGKMVATNRYGRLQIPNGDAKIMMVVFNKRVTFYVNDEQVVSGYDGSIRPGVVALTLLSGTNKDFGTRCKMSEINLWIFQ